MEKQLAMDKPSTDARDNIVSGYLWRSGPTSRLDQVLSYVAPKAIQGMVHMRELRATPSHVHAVGLGGKNGGDEPAVVVYVTRKLPEDQIPADEIVPKTVNGLPTDVVESPIARLAACTDERRKRNRPLIGGVSLARNAGPAGTLGAFVTSTRAGDPAGAVYILSNSHVLFSGSGSAKGVRVVQPAPDDGQAERVALLERATSLTTGKPLSADAAIARVDQAAAFSNTICGIGAVAAAQPPEKKMVVEKHGRTSGLTVGTIVAIGLSVEALDEHNRRLRFTNVFRVEPETAGTPVARLGDSGSLVVRQADHAAVGLLFAADPGGTFYLAQPIDDVCKALEIALKLD